MTKQNIILPIDEYLPSIQQSIQIKNRLIIQAAPGAGKTTRVPVALLPAVPGKILVLEPRRLAAKLSAERVAHELGEVPGQTVGFQIRFENIESENTRIKYITEGVFNRLVLSDPKLQNISCVIIDEFHERHLHTDIALMLIYFIQNTIRPDLKLIVMSATLETNKLTEYLANADTIISAGINYPVEIEYTPEHELKKPLSIQVYNAIVELINKNKYYGDFLVFLPGSHDIQRCNEVLEDLTKKQNLEIIKLKADTPKHELQKLFEKTANRKIILATNVAETSITIQGVTNVIDSGLAKIAGHASWSGLPTLDLMPISQASIIQRTGRAGRTAAGIAKRLFTLNDFNARAAFQKPEIQRIDLAQSILELKMIQEKLNIAIDIFQLPWFELPAPQNFQACLQLLKLLGALNITEQITEEGKQICQFPLHPRLGKLLVTAKNNHCLPTGILIVSLINEGFLFKKNFTPDDLAHSDLTFQMEIFKHVIQKKNLPYQLNNAIDKSSLQRIENLMHQLCKILNISYSKCFHSISEENLSLLLLSAFPDRICQVRKLNKKSSFNHKELNLCLGGGALLTANSVVQDSEFLIAIDAEEAATALSQAHSTLIRVAHGIEPELLMFAPDEFIKEMEDFFWDEQAQRVRGTKKTLYGKLVLEEKSITNAPEKFAEILLKELKTQWPKPFENETPYLYFINKLKLAKENGIVIDNISIESFELNSLLKHISIGKKSFTEILEKNLDDYLSELFNYDDYERINKLFPTYIKIGKGRKVKVHYENDKPPWIASRLQDFFGTKETPKICNQTIPLVVHLLAPNMQSVQVTQDLNSFWQKGYYEVKKDLSRRYPKHSWPDDPISAEAPELIKRK